MQKYSAFETLRPLNFLLGALLLKPITDPLQTPSPHRYLVLVTLLLKSAVQK